MDTCAPAEPTQLPDVSEPPELAAMDESAEPDKLAEVQMIVSRFRASAHRLAILNGIFFALNDTETKNALVFLKHLSKHHRMIKNFKSAFKVEKKNLRRGKR